MLWAMGTVGVSALVQAALRMGGGGFLLFCLASIGLYALLGAAWWASSPGEPLARWPLFTWARLAREGANDLLPFSQIGGLVVGARTLVRSGLKPARVYAAMVCDLSTEMVSQAVFTLLGLVALGTALTGGTGTRLTPLAWAGVAASVAMAAAFVLLQRPMLRWGAALAGKLLPAGAVALEDVQAELRDIYGRRRAVGLSFLFNLAAWFAASALGALALGLIGEPLPVWRVVALESLIFALRGVAFLIPGAIGVQEAGYVLLAPLVGLDPQAAMALSLVKRARDVALGLPALIAWQAIDMKPRHRAARLS